MSSFIKLKQLQAVSVGSIIFSGVNGQLTEDNTNLFWDNTNNRLGIGTITPSTRLQVKGTGTTSSTNSLRVENSSNVATLIVRDDGHITAGVGTSLTIGLLAKFDNTQVNNTSIGYNAGGGNRNTFIGAGAGAAVTTSAAGRNVAVGNGSAASFTTDFGHTAIGWSALQAQSGRTSTADGAMNVAVGYNTMQLNSTGTSNTAIGSNSLQSNTAGTNNVALGGTAGQLCTGSNNLFVGYNAGRNQTTESNQLFIDNIGRTTKALELTNALIRGTFNANPALQYLRFNASLGIGVDAAARLHVLGLGNTSSTLGLEVESANTQNWLRVYDDGTLWSQGAANNAHLFAAYAGNVSVTYDSPSIQYLEFKVSGVIKSQLINQSGLTRFNQASGQAWGVYGSDNNPYILFDETNKRVGIATATPSATLDLVGTLQYTDGNQAAGKVLTSDASGNATWETPAAASVLTDDVTISTNTAGELYVINGVSKYSEASSSLTASTAYTVTHNIGTTMIQVTVWDRSTGEMLTGFTADNRTSNSVDITVSVTGNYDIIVTG